MKIQKIAFVSLASAFLLASYGNTNIATSSTDETVTALINTVLQA